jgi:hypothetical protein
VATNPGLTDSPTFVLADPGPTQCPAGIDVFKDPGPTGAPQGVAVTLPLTADSCQAGIGLFDTELSLLGASVPGPSPVGAVPSPAAGPCPDGDVAFAALQAALATVPVQAPGGFVLKDPGPQGAPGGFVLKDPGPNGVPGVSFAYTEDATGAATGLYVEKNPGPPGFQLFVLAPSGTPGVSVLKNPGPTG